MKFEENAFKIIIILVEPNGPINVGSIARLCANFKVHELRIISPRCDINSLDARKMALKGSSYLKQCKIYENLIEAICDCDLVLATSGKIDTGQESKICSLEKASNWVRSFKGIKNLAIVFGREDRGLSNKELLMAQKIFTINTFKNYPSLNLSHAVSIVLYEFNNLENLDHSEEKQSINLAKSSEIEECFMEVKNLLLKVGYLLPHTSNAKIAKFKKYILKTKTSTSELNILRGIVSQINWALKNLKNIN